jgi:uncharacterized phage protein (TIGR02216 family)
MCFGLGRLRLSSEHFWALTPTEIAAAARSFQPEQTEALKRKSLAALLSQYPDDPSDR